MSSWRKEKIDDLFLVTDYVANGSFASLKENVQYNYEKDYAVLVRTTDNTKGWNGNYVYVNKDSYDFLKKSSVKPKDLIIANVGEPGKAFLCPDLGQPMTLGPNSILVRPIDPEVVYQEFFYYYTLSNYGQGQIQEICSATTQKKFNKTSYRKIEIPLPPLPQQKKIAAILDAADAYKQKTKALIDKYDELTQSLFLDMFGDPVTNPQGWENLKIGEAILKGYILKVQDGNHGELHPKSEDFLLEGTPMVFANNLTNNRLSYEGGHHLSDEVVSGLRIGFSTGGDVLLTHKGSIGLSDVVPDSVELLILSPQVTYYRVDQHKLNPVYLKFYFLSKFFFRNLEKLGKQSTRSYVGITKQRLLPLIMPDITLQNQFAERTKTIEKQKAQAKASLFKAEDLFNSLLQKAFKGELVS